MSLEKSDLDVARMVELITGGLASQVVRTFAELSIADVLADSSMTVDEICAATGTNPDATTRLLRAGIALGLVTMTDARFLPTPLLGTLRQDSPVSLAGWATIMGSPGAWLPWGRFVDAIKTGERQTVPALGKEYFEYLSGAPAEAKAFTDGMSGISASIGAAAAAAIDASMVSVAADIGGASGSLLHALLRTNPHLKGIVYDRPDVVPFAESATQMAGLGERSVAIAGDFFRSVPEAGLYLLKWILHDWDDDHSIAILKNCRRSIRPEGRVVVMELQLGEMDDPGLPSLMDLNMLVVLNGRERTTREYSALFTKADLRLIKATPLQAPLGPWIILEAAAA